MNSKVDTLLAKLDAHPRSLLFARLADEYLKSDKTDEAIQICEQGLSHHTDYATGHMVMAKCYFKVGLFDQAKAECLRTLELESEHVGALLCLGDMCAEERNVDSARRFYDDIMRIDHMSETGKKRMQHLTRNGSSQGVGDDSEPDIVVPHEDAIYTTTLAEIYASQGLTVKAIEVLRHVLKKNPDRREVQKRIQELEEQARSPETGGEYGHNR